MAYTTPGRVGALCSKVPGWGSASSRVNDNQVLDWIADTDAEINVCLSARGHTAPVVDEGYLLTWLGKLSTEGVAATALKSIFMDATGPNSEGAWAVWERRYKDGLKRILDGLLPTGLDEDDGSLPGGNDAEPIFEVATVW